VKWFYPPQNEQVKEQVHEYRMHLEDLSGIALT